MPEILNGIVNIGGPILGSIASALTSNLFIARNAGAKEIAEIKAGKLVETLNQLRDEGKITWMEYYKCKNAFEIAKLADARLSKNNVDTETIKENANNYDMDWFMKFYEYAGTVSNEEAQKLWASVLANEIEKPNTTPLSLLHCLSIMEHEEALFFCNISRFVLQDFKDASPHLLLFVSSSRAAYKNSKITPEKLKNLEHLGLVECDFINEYIFNDKKYFRAGNHSIKVFGDPNNNNKIKAGNAVFTKNGKILYSIIDSNYKQYNADILNYTISKFKNRNCNVVVNERKMF